MFGSNPIFSVTGASFAGNLGTSYYGYSQDCYTGAYSAYNCTGTSNGFVAYGAAGYPYADASVATYTAGWVL